MYRYFLYIFLCVFLFINLSDGEDLKNEDMNTTRIENTTSVTPNFTNTTCSKTEPTQVATVTSNQETGLSSTKSKDFSHHLNSKKASVKPKRLRAYRKFVPLTKVRNTPLVIQYLSEAKSQILRMTI